MLCCFIIYFDYFKFGEKFRIINSKFRSTLFKGLRVWAEPINAINFRTFLIAKRLSVFGGLNITAIAKCESDKKKSYATKTTDLPLFKGKLATHANFCVL